MPKARISSAASPNLRIDLAGSRLQAASLAGLGIAAAAGLFLTDLPTPVAALASPLCLAWAALLARREWGRPGRWLVLRTCGGVEVDGAAVEAFSVEWRGTLACLRWTTASGREHVVIWPDRLDAAARRELRLWALARRADAVTAAVAP